MKPSANPFIRSTALAALSFALALGTAQAATFTWNGSSPVSNDFSAANWTGAAPTDINGHVIAFGPLSSPSRTTANNNLAGNPDQFAFNAGAAAMTVTGGRCSLQRVKSIR
jgi:hypothetical protein